MTDTNTTISAQAFLDNSLSALFEKFGGFFAFGNEQFLKKRVEGVEYKNIFGGGCLPRANVKPFMVELAKLHTQYREMNLKEKGREGLIEYELSSKECYYSGDIHGAVEALEVYGITLDEVLAVYHSTKFNYE